MTDLELQKALLSDYENALKDLPNSFISAFLFLENLNMEYGICCLSQFKYYIKIHKEKWVNEKCETSNYWAKTPKQILIGPNFSDSYSMLIESLETRIKILKEIIANQ